MRKKIEQETCVTMNSEEDEAIIWSCQPKVIRSIEKTGITAFRIHGESKMFKVNKKWVSIRKPKVMNLSAEQKEAIKARFKGKS